MLRGGRFDEKIEVGVPCDHGYLRLIDKYLGPIPLSASLTGNPQLRLAEKTGVGHKGSENATSDFAFGREQRAKANYD